MIWYRAGLGEGEISIAFLIQSVDPRPYEKLERAMGLLDYRDEGRCAEAAVGGVCAVFLVGWVVGIV